MDHIINSDEDSDAEDIINTLVQFSEDSDVVEEPGEDVEVESVHLEEFDINLPAEHSYLPGLQTVRGHSVLDPGWTGQLSCWMHNGVVFPGEMVPMYSDNIVESTVLLQAIRSKSLFGLLSPDGADIYLSNYGVLCEFLEASEEVEEGGQHASFKARARQRFRLFYHTKQRIQRHLIIADYKVQILPDVIICDPLYNIRLSSLGGQRNNEIHRCRSRQAEALLTSLPPFIFKMTDIKRMIRHIQLYFRELSFENLPEDPLTLSFWVATNLSLPPRDRLALFTENNALLRLFMELKHIVSQKSVLSCRECMRAICKKENIFPMSREGLYSNYCNSGGYIHNITTAKAITNLVLQGNPSEEFSWFPGYAWTIAVCDSCLTHIGWRFNATGKSMVPREFWGLSRKSLIPT